LEHQTLRASVFRSSVMTWSCFVNGVVPDVSKSPLCPRVKWTIWSFGMKGMWYFESSPTIHQTSVTPLLESQLSHLFFMLRHFKNSLCDIFRTCYASCKDSVRSWSTLCDLHIYTPPLYRMWPCRDTVATYYVTLWQRVRWHCRDAVTAYYVTMYGHCGSVLCDTVGTILQRIMWHCRDTVATYYMTLWQRVTWHCRDAVAAYYMTLYGHCGSVLCGTVGTLLQRIMWHCRDTVAAYYVTR
jgi:hypothetical protein